MVCKENHRYDSKFSSLPESQTYPARHLCAGCAYDLGYSDAQDNKLPNFNLEDIPKSQAGEVRHKDPRAAYCLGYLDGLKDLED